MATDLLGDAYAVIWPPLISIKSVPSFRKIDDSTVSLGGRRLRTIEDDWRRLLQCCQFFNQFGYAD